MKTRSKHEYSRATRHICMTSAISLVTRAADCKDYHHKRRLDSKTRKLRVRDFLNTK